MSSPTFDFHKPPYQLHFEHEPDYAPFEEMVKTLKLVSSVTDINMYIIDFHKQNYFYLSWNKLFEKSIYDVEDARSLNGKFATKIIPEKEKKRHMEMQVALLSFLSSLDVEEQKQMTIYSIHGIEWRNGKVYSVINQYTPIAFDDKGKMWMLLGITNVYIKNNKNQSYVESRKTGQRFIYSSKQKKFVPAGEVAALTSREKEILLFSSQGFSSKEMALQKNISLETVKYHKKNILSKFNVQSMTEAISYAQSHNLIFN